MMVVATREAGLQPSELVPEVHLSDDQSNRSLMVDAVRCNLPGAHRDILEAIRQQVAPGVQSPNGVVRHQLVGLQLLRQGCNKKNMIRQEERNKVKITEETNFSRESYPQPWCRTPPVAP